MKLYQIPLIKGDKIYKIEPLTGSLIYFENHEAIKKVSFPQKLVNALELCNNPYLLLPYNMSLPQQIRKKAQVNAKVISVLSKVSFWVSNNLNSIIKPIYSDSKQGIEVFRSLYSGTTQDEMCLPRSIFASCMSKKYKEYGVIFIGVFLPSKSMHAWIIEDGMQPDVNDNIWINFTPVAALC